jgi:UDP-N-acetylglucosamine 2-epimerase (non-hydrolysing)
MTAIAIVLGTRPEAIKCAPVIRALRETSEFTPIVVSTGQHRELLDEALDAFDIRADVDLDVMTERQSLTQVTHRVLAGLEEALPGLDAAAVVVHGDTATTVSSAIAAFQQGVPVVHIEAGLRSGNLHSPYPEEANRRLVGQIAQLHLAPTSGNCANLIREGVAEDRIVVTGNTVVDALQWAAAKDTGYGDPALADLDADERPVILASAHRRESWPMLAEIGAALHRIAQERDVRIVLPLHGNPTVHEGLLPHVRGLDNLTVVEPLPYLSFCQLMKRADIILSDSSGAEEEGPALHKATLVLRDISEREEAINAGAARLVGRTADGIAAGVFQLLDDPDEMAKMVNAVNPYGDGRAAERVVGAIAHVFGDGPAVVPFVPGRHTPELNPV